MTRKLVLYARPRIAPLHRWPHHVAHGYVRFEWVTVKPGGAGWSFSPDSMLMLGDDHNAFPVDDLDSVIEAFFESVAGPYPFDFSIRVIEPPAHQPRSRSKAKRKIKTAKRTTAKTGRSKKRTRKP